MEPPLKLGTIWALAVLAATSALALPPSAPPLTLDECLREALGRNSELEAQRYELSAASDAVWKAQSALFPQLTADILTQTLKGTPTGPFNLLAIQSVDDASSGQQSQVQTQANFGTVGQYSMILSYGLFQNGSILGLNNAPAVAWTKSARTQQEWTYRLSAQEVEYKLTNAFYQAVSDRQQLELATSKVALSTERLEILKTELQVNLKLDADVALGQAQLAADRQALVTCQEHSWESQALLGTLIGRTNELELRLDLSAPRIPPVPALPALIKIAAKSHPAIGVQQAKIDIARQDLRIVQSQMLPSAKLIGNFTEATDFRRADANLLVVGVQVSVPIFDFGHLQAATRQSRNLLLAEQARMGQVEDTLRNSLIMTVSALHSIESNLANLQREDVAAKNKAQLIEAQRELGMIDQLAVVNAKWDLVAVTQTLDLQMLAQRLQYANLQYVTGGLWKWPR